MRGLRNLRDVGGIKILVAGGRHWSSKWELDWLWRKGTKVEEGRDRECKSPWERHVLHSAALGKTRASTILYTTLPLLIFSPPSSNCP